MRDELNRSRGLKVLSLEAPYFIEYTIEDGDSFEVSASLGGLVSVRHDRFRVPEIKVRVGDYKFDNTDYVGSGYHFGTHYDIERFPLENSYEVMRRFLWLATDSAYKSAVEAISRKRAALNNVAVNQPLDDFARAEPLKKMMEIRASHRSMKKPGARGCVTLSAIFEAYPAVKASSVELSAVQTGAVLPEFGRRRSARTRRHDLLAGARRSASAGWDAAARRRRHFSRSILTACRPSRNCAAASRPWRPTWRRGPARPKARIIPVPCCLKAMAGAQLFAEVLGGNLALTRRPVMDPGRNNLSAR